MTKFTRKKGGRPFKLCGIVKKMHIVKRRDSLKALMLAYLDESKKARGPAWVANQQTLASLPEASHREMLEAHQAPLRPGKDFVQGGDEGNVRVFGFLQRHIPHVWPSTAGQQEQNLDALWQWWDRQTTKRKKKAHHFVFSLNPKVAEKLNERGMEVDAALFGLVNETVNRFGAAFHPNSSLGFVAGVHHDRAHPHVHVLMFPTNEEGKQINFSRMSKAKLKGKEVRIDYQGFLHKTFHDLGADFTERLYRTDDKPKPAISVSEPAQFEFLASHYHNQNRVGRGFDFEAYRKSRQELVTTRNLTEVAESTYRKATELFLNPPSPKVVSELAIAKAANFQKILGDLKTGHRQEEDILDWLESSVRDASESADKRLAATAKLLGNPIDSRYIKTAVEAPGPPTKETKERDRAMMEKAAQLMAVDPFEKNVTRLAIQACELVDLDGLKRKQIPAYLRKPNLSPEWQEALRNQAHVPAKIESLCREIEAAYGPCDLNQIANVDLSPFRKTAPAAEAPEIEPEQDPDAEGVESLSLTEGPSLHPFARPLMGLDLSALVRLGALMPEMHKDHTMSL